jgi:hypothetical protein
MAEAGNLFALGEHLANQLLGVIRIARLEQKLDDILIRASVKRPFEERRSRK